MPKTGEKILGTDDAISVPLGQEKKGVEHPFKRGSRSRGQERRKRSKGKGGKTEKGSIFLKKEETSTALSCGRRLGES